MVDNNSSDNSPLEPTPGTGATFTAAAEGATGFKPLMLDVELYQRYLDDPSIEDADKRELIETLWSIMVSFVDLGFGIHPAQQAQRHRDPGEEIAEGLEPAAPAMVSSSHAKKEKDRPGRGASCGKGSRHA